MGKRFNISADCKPDLHYMVNIEERLAKIKAMVDRGDYFTINRARQYGKTTTLRLLGRLLKKDYTVISMDFQLMGASKFKNENTFSLAFAQIFVKAMEAEYGRQDKMPSAAVYDGRQEETLCAAICDLKQALRSQRAKIELFELFGYLSNVCGSAPKPLVLMIDEVDSAADNQVFVDFLAQLRGYYIDRDETPTFRSVILAGVYDVKNMKLKIRPKDGHRRNSPWNIAVDFLLDMSFSGKDIAGMLEAYEKDYQTRMDVGEVAGLIYAYTSGYPFLVSCICKLIDEQLAGSEAYPDRKDAWTTQGVLKAVRILLAEQNTLFESLVNKLEDYPQLREMLHDLLFRGKEINYVVGVRPVELALMLGFVKKEHHAVVPANRVFETLLYNFFLASPTMQRERIYDAALKEKNQFIRGGHLDMELVLERFVQHFHDLYGDSPQHFLEDDGRRYFLLYLMPIINGTGNYYIESQTRNMERTDVIVDYLGEQFVIELKVWRGNAYHERGEGQLAEYLDYYHVKKGYLISFNFNKKKQIGLRTNRIGNKILVEAVV